MDMHHRYNGIMRNAFAFICAAAVLVLQTPLGHGHQCWAASKPKGQTAKATPPAQAPDEQKAAQQKAEEAALNQALATTTPVGPFSETTTTNGSAPVDLTGVWLVVVHTKPSPEHAPDKYQSFVQLLKVTDGATAKPTFHILDVQLPMQGEIDKATRALTPWNPTPEQLAALKQSWSSLPLYKEKNLNQNIIASVDYTVATPDHYQEALKDFPAQLLDGSTFALRVFERYRPGNVPEKSPVNIAQLMGRESIYTFAAKGDPPAQLNGQAVVKFTVAGAGFPLPLNFGGSVQMFKVGAPNT